MSLINMDFMNGSGGGIDEIDIPINTMTYDEWYALKSNLGYTPKYVIVETGENKTDSGGSAYSIYCIEWNPSTNIEKMYSANQNDQNSWGSESTTDRFKIENNTLYYRPRSASYARFKLHCTIIG